MTTNPFVDLLKWFGPNGERWYQGTYFLCESGMTSHFIDPTDPPVKACLLGGIEIVANSHFEKAVDFDSWCDGILNKTSCEMFPSYAHQVYWHSSEKIQMTFHIGNWNDAEDRTFDDVRALLEKCALRWEEAQATA